MCDLRPIKHLLQVLMLIHGKDRWPKGGLWEQVHQTCSRTAAYEKVWYQLRGLNDGNYTPLTGEGRKHKD